MDYQVVLSPSATADLVDIVRYVSFDAPDRARFWHAARGTPNISAWD
jgi:hypothetical protein